MSENYKYSSAIDYAGGKGILEVEVIKMICMNNNRIINPNNNIVRDCKSRTTGNLPYIDGIAMFDYGELTQLVANGEEVCFYVLMCIDDQICKAKVCIKAAELLSMSGSKSKSKTNTTQTNTQTKIDKDSPYLVPNPAETYVTIEGIEPTNITEVFLIDITGKKLKVISNNNTLDINDIPSGTYFVRVMNKSQKAYYLKLIKK